MKVENVRVYGMRESIIASGYPKRVSCPNPNEFVDEVYDLDLTNMFNKESCGSHTKRAMLLGSAKVGSGHDAMLKGIIVQYDLTCNHVMLPQFMRYHFHDIISSQSKMHRIVQMDLKSICGIRVRQDIIEACMEEIEIYKNMIEHKDEFDKSEFKEQYEVIMENLPMGLELTMRITTNYLQEKSIFNQRENHPMEYWDKYCKWQVETLPYFVELTGINVKEK